MARKFNLCRISGFQIALDYTWFIIFGLATWGLATGYFPKVIPGMSTTTYWIQGAVATLMLFVSVLFHTDYKHQSVRYLYKWDFDQNIQLGSQSS